MKTKNKTMTEVCMKKEKRRALAQVKFLENVYKEMKQKEKK